MKNSKEKKWIINESKDCMEIIMIKGTLIEGEFHPSADLAMNYVKHIFELPDYPLLKNSIVSGAMMGFRIAEICLETLERLERKEPVSDRYLLGLAIFIKDITDPRPEE